MTNSVKPERQVILDRIKKCEKEGNFDLDVEDDPVSSVLMPNDIDYLKKSLISKLKTFFVVKKGDKVINELIKQRQIIIKDVVGIENLQKINGSVFITSNHFHPFENMALYMAFKKYAPKKHKFYRVIREGNYTAPPKGFDLFFKHANTLPVSSNVDTMKKFVKAIEVLCKKNNSYILMYPEQYMWWNHKKPRPFKDGVFKFSARFNTPIVPCFITMEDSDVLDADGLFVQEYTIHILKPIYPNPNLSVKENCDIMRDKNFEMWKEVYESTYGKKLVYNGED